MITKYGTIVFSRYKELAKEVGEDKAQALVFECIRQLEKEGIVSENSTYTNKQVGKRAIEIIDRLKLEWKDDRI